jgi:predicted anti-sigma-YlaC factor YlaD
MKCDEIRELMPDLAAGLATSTAQIEEHLRACAGCAGKLQELRQTMALLDEWQAPESSPYFDTRLQARLREERAKEAGGWLQWMRKPALAIALVAVMAVGVSLYRGRRSHTVSTPAPPPAVVATAADAGAVDDLQALDKNHDLLSDFDVLDDLQVQQDVTANP